MKGEAPPVTEREYVHERLGNRFAAALSEYDTRRRVEVLVDDFFPNTMLAGKTVLDVGCGLGFFSERLVQRGASVTACDIGPSLAARTRERAGCSAVVVDALSLCQFFGKESFDVVVSSECIEHTRSPDTALSEMAAVLKPGGYIALSTPNLLWYPIVRLSTIVGLRPFDGFENFSSWRSIRRSLASNHVRIIQEYGLHILPFQIPCHRLLTWGDRHLQFARCLMINICVLGRKE